MMKQASPALAYPQALVKQEGVWLQWQQWALSRSATLWARVGFWRVHSSSGWSSPSECFRYVQPTSKSVSCLFGAWGVQGGGPGGSVAKLPYLASPQKKQYILLLASCERGPEL